MKKVFKDYLFTKGILIYEDSEVKERMDEDAINVYLAFAEKLAIRIRKGMEYATLDIFKYAQEMLGVNVPLPFYKGFPESVRSMSSDQLLFDQIFHYLMTYGTDFEMEDAKHSVLEEAFERTYFHENVKVRDFVILPEAMASDTLMEAVKDLCAGSRALSDDLYTVVLEYCKEYETKSIKFGSKDLQIRLLVDAKELAYAKGLDLSDFLKIVERLVYDKYGQTNLKKLNLKNQDRKFLSIVLHNLFIDSETYHYRLMFERRKDWCGILHHIHFKPGTSREKAIANMLRDSKIDNFSFMAGFERELGSHDIPAAIDYITHKGSGAYLRNLDYMLSGCQDEKDVEYLIDHIPTDNGMVLMQLMLHYRDFVHGNLRYFQFTKFGMSKGHAEEYSEALKRKTNLPEELTDRLYSEVRNKVLEHYADKLGKVYIEPGMDRYTIPMYESAGFGGFGVLSKGSRIQIPKGKIIRVFTYWEKVNDIDLSILGLYDDERIREISWRTFGREKKALRDIITFSGDETNGWDGGSEYFDVDIEKIKTTLPGCKYLLFCDNVYSHGTFKRCVCRAGYMLRDRIGSGEIYEPATVQSAFGINCNSSDAYLFAIDVNTNELIWLNIPKTGMNPIAGNDPTGVKSVRKYLDIANTWNVQLFAETIGTEIVNDPKLADVIFSDKYYDLHDGQEQIKPNDFEKFAKLFEL